MSKVYILLLLITQVYHNARFKKRKVSILNLCSGRQIFVTSTHVHPL